VCSPSADVVIVREDFLLNSYRVQKEWTSTLPVNIFLTEDSSCLENLIQTPQSELRRRGTGMILYAIPAFLRSLSAISAPLVE